MSVYKHSHSPFFHYDFQIRGVRFTGSTGCTSQRDAKAFEKDRREEARAQLKRDLGQASAPMTFAVAAASYFIEVGQHLRGHGPKECKRAIEWLEREIGGHTLLSVIDDRLVARLVAVRRGQGVANATVNRSATEPLRKILNRARDIWKQRVERIDWKRHRLAEPQERVRTLSSVEEDVLFKHLRVDYHPVVQFALLSGCRLCELVPGAEFPGLRWSDIDWASRTITVLGKGRVTGTIPISAGLHDVLLPLRGDNPEFVFTYVCQRRSKERLSGKRYPITREGLKTAWRRTKLDAGLLTFRFHDCRHTAATSLLRATGNLKIVQKLLRHRDITTTAKYAHSLADDVRDAMDASEKSRKESRSAFEQSNKLLSDKQKIA